MAEEESFQVDGRAGEPIELPIAGGPATGYAWRLELPEGVVRLEDGAERDVEARKALGGAAGGYLRVMAAESGEYTLTGRLARPWTTDQPVRTVVIRLQVK